MRQLSYGRFLKGLFYFFLCGFLVALGSQPAIAQDNGAWKQKWDKTLTAAKKEGKLVVFGPPGNLVRRAVTEGFHKAFPNIVIEYSAARGGAQAAKVKAERDAGIHHKKVRPHELRRPF